MANNESKKEIKDKKTTKKSQIKKTSKKVVTKEPKKKEIIETTEVKDTNEDITNKIMLNKHTSKNNVFKTKEVIFLIIVTCVVSLIMGFAICNNLNYKNKISEDKYLQKFIDNYDTVVKNYYDTVDKEKLLNAALDGMISSLDDQYSTMLDEDYATKFNRELSGSYKGLGFEFYNDEEGNNKILKVFSLSPANEAGLKVGDIITAVDGVSVVGKKTTDVLTYANGSNESYKFTILRGNETKEITIKWGAAEIDAVDTNIYQKNDKKIGYISLSTFSKVASKQFKRNLEKLEKNSINSLIIDLRGNSGGYLTTAVDIASLFLDKNTILYQTDKKGEITKFYSNNNETRKYSIVVLQDSYSASASEMLSAALKEQYGAKIVGTASYGKGTIQELITLSNGTEYKYTTKKWLTSKGKWVEKVGVTPNIEVQLDSTYQENPTEENDKQLQTAIETLSGE